jgi:hypothetical protein
VPDQVKSNVNAENNTNPAQQPPPNHPPPPIEGNEDGKGGNDENGGKKVVEHKQPKHWVEYVEGLCAIALVAITGTYTYYARQQADSAIKSAKAATVAADAAKSAAETAANSLTQSQANFRNEERAWIELDEPKASLAPPADTPAGSVLYRFPMYLRNVGQTSAFDIKVRFYNPVESADFVHNKPDIERLQLPIAILRQKEIESVHRDFGPKMKVGVYEGFSVPGVLAPGIHSNAPFLILASTPTEARRGRPEPLNYFTVLVGRVEYADAFGTGHWMKFCYYVWDDEGDIQNCPYGNDEDRYIAKVPPTQN